MNDTVFSNRRVLQRLSALVTVAFVLCLPPAVYSCVAVWLNCHNDVEAWASRGSATEAAQEQFEQLYGGHESVTVTWGGATSGDERLIRYAEALREPSRQELFTVVASTPELMRGLIDEPTRLPPGLAEDRLRGWATGVEGSSGRVLVAVSAEGARDRRRVMRALREAADSVGVRPADLRLAGSAYWLAEIDRLSVESPLFAIPLIVVVVVLGVRARLGAWLVTASVIGVGLGASAITTALVHWCGVHMNAVLSTLPTLVFLIGVANCLHIANHFLSAEEGDPVSAMRAAVGVTFRPTLFAGLTTTLGLFALLVSGTEPIRQFGWFGGLGVGLATCLALLVMPRIGGRRVWTAARFAAAQRRYKRRSRPELWRRWHAGVERWRWVIVAAATALIPLSLLGLMRLETSVQPAAFFKPGSLQLESVDWLERRFGGLDSYDIVIEFDRARGLRLVDQLIGLMAIRREVEGVSGIEAVVAVDTFAPSVNARSGVRATGRRALVNDQLTQHFGELQERRLVAREEETMAWRLNAHVSSSADLDTIREQLEAALESYAARSAGRAPRPDRWWIAGTASLFRQVEKQFLQDLVTTYVAGLALVTAAVVALLRSLRTGVLAMAPNALPGVAVLGAAGWLGVVLEVGSIMTASVAIGIAVDDTMHFLSYYRRCRRLGSSPSAASRAALENCGSAMVQTSLICGGGLALFALCDFLPTVRFGLLLTSMLSSALAADVLLLPALIACFPRWFGGGERPQRLEAVS